MERRDNHNDNHTVKRRGAFASRRFAMRTFAEDRADFRDRAGAEGDADTLHALSKTAPFSHFADAISVLVERETENTV
ncbi:hypothetical protein ACVIHI_001274 [Bradyrhizobium sp. USDA 4524]|uniref:hypothetical protein n=1 Tax=Bradyrhizobium TaxID=374 RepID=UPI00209DAD53|nr:MULTISPECIES: hypothetical protein [Bradyrhizobium]MCP1837353.1 hypothetical protein [Bradyrhizobium sp. USDA 4538]MCP1906371.1 hypothetical protein [Bradyrhizobium sp. USDA 4537]MCP1987974.1 hypothetical protein [Bradyrhizobium sp. USDA 4539]MCP3418861.1 hypothetical protein [Bradyrhizobium brasilense]